MRQAALGMMRALTMQLEDVCQCQKRWWLNAVQQFDAETETLRGAPIEKVLARAVAAIVVSEKTHRNQHSDPQGAKYVLKVAARIACNFSRAHEGSTVSASDIIQEERALMMLTGFRVCVTSPSQFIELFLNRFNVASKFAFQADLKQLVEASTDIAIRCACCCPCRVACCPSVVSRGSIYLAFLQAGIVQSEERSSVKSDAEFSALRVKSAHLSEPNVQDANFPGRPNSTVIHTALLFAFGNNTEEPISQDAVTIASYWEPVRNSNDSQKDQD